MQTSWFYDIPENGVISLLRVYLISSCYFGGYRVMDIAIQQSNFLERISRTPVEPSDAINLFLLALCGGAIGGVAYSQDKPVKYATKDNTNFNLRPSGEYLIRHLVAAKLAAVFFALVLGGYNNVDQLAGATGTNESVFDTTSGYFAFALGFLTGCGS